MTAIIIILLILILFMQFHINSKIPPRNYAEEAEQKYKQNKE